MPPIADHNLTVAPFSAPRRSLRRRMLIALLLVFVLGFGVSAAHVYGSRDELRRAVLMIQAQAASSGFTSDQPLSSLPRHFANGELGYTLYSPAGQLVGFSDYLGRPRKLRKEMLRHDTHWWRWSAYGGNTINAPVRLPDGSTLMVSRNDLAERKMLNELLLDRLRHSLIFMLPLGLLAVGLILLLLNWTLRPVRQAARLAQGIGPATPQRRIPLGDLPNEFHPLALAANQALDRLAGAYAAERRFTADAAHELRTPLTVLDLRLQDAQRSGQTDWPRLNSEMRQLRRLVSQLLELARHDHAAESTSLPEQSHLSRVVREATASMLPIFEAQQRKMLSDIEDGLFCCGNADELREALINLLENALKHGAGSVKVTLHSEQHEIFLDVADQGDGVIFEEQERMFQRFYKGIQGSDGTGLGLAIVRRIVENARGSVSFVPGSHTLVRITLAHAENKVQRRTNQSASAPC